MSRKVSVKLILDVAIDYCAPFSLKRVRFSPTVQGKLEAKLEGKVKGSLGEVRVPVSPPLLGPTITVTVGVVPVVFIPVVRFYAVANGEIESGFERTSSVDFSTGFGAELKDGRVSPAGEANASANLVPKFNSSAGFTLGLAPGSSPDLMVRVYGVPGPYLDVDAPRLEAAFTRDNNPPAYYYEREK